MAVGLSQANFANSILTALDSTAATLTSANVRMHTADPGSAGTTAAAANLTVVSNSLTWGAASGTDPRQRAITTTLPSWTATGAETLTHLTVWNEAGFTTFRFSAALTASKTVANTDTLNLTSLVFSLTPIAA